MSYKIFLIYHSHIDIGYTERQEKIAVYQADFIKQAVERVLSPEQDKRDENCKFKFTAEGFWAVEQYLNKYGSQGKERLLEAIRTGYFEITGCYVHLAELLNYDNLNKSLDYAKDFAQDNNLNNIKVAMASDINGFSWGFAEALFKHNIRYLSTNINVHHGGTPFGKPLNPFYWETHEGNKILVWNGFAYHKANQMGLIPGLSPIWDPVLPEMPDFTPRFIDITCPDDYAAGVIFTMIDILKKNGYKYDFMPVMGSGLFTDNSPVGDEHCKLVEQWNLQYGDQVEIVTATLTEYFKYLEDNGGDIPTYKGDWNDWWTDGALSTPSELKVFRNAQRLQSQIKKLDPENKIITKEEHDQISNNLILFSEHTWGHSGSYCDAGKLLVQQMDLRKVKRAIDADVLASVAFDKLTRVLGEGEFTHNKPFTYNIVNPHEYPIKTIAYLPTDFWEDGHFDTGYSVYDQNGNRLESQRTHTLRGSFVSAVIELSAKECNNVNLVFENTDTERSICLDQDNKKFENEFYTFSYDDNGAISIINKKTGNSLINMESSARKLGQPVYQVFPSGNRSDPGGYAYRPRKKPADKIFEGEITGINVLEIGPVFSRIRFEYNMESTKRCATDFTLYNDLPKIDMTFEMTKELVLDAEGMYVAFPFALDNAKWFIDKPDTLIRAGSGLPETCCDYFPFDRGFVLKGEGESIVINSFDTPLAMFGTLNLWNYTTKSDASGTAYSWLLNNKWETNFRAQCAGFFESRYTIEISDGLNDQKVLERNNMEALCLRNS